MIKKFFLCIGGSLLLFICFQLSVLYYSLFQRDSLVNPLEQRRQVDISRAQVILPETVFTLFDVSAESAVITEGAGQKGQRSTLNLQQDKLVTVNGTITVRAIFSSPDIRYALIDQSDTGKNKKQELLKLQVNDTVGSLTVSSISSSQVTFVDTAGKEFILTIFLGLGVQKKH